MSIRPGYNYKIFFYHSVSFLKIIIKKVIPLKKQNHFYKQLRNLFQAFFSPFTLNDNTIISIPDIIAKIPNTITIADAPAAIFAKT